MAERVEDSFTEILVTWQDPAVVPMAGYSVEYTRVEDNKAEMRSVPSGTTTFTITGE